MRFGPWLVLALSLLSASARADPPEYMRALVLHPADARLMVLRFDSGYGGLLISRDGGHTFSLLPSLAISKYALRWDAPMLFANDGKLLLGLDEGLFVDDGEGCGFSAAGSPLEGIEPVDLAPHPSDPAVTFALTQAHPDRDLHAGLWQRTAKETTPLGASDPRPAPQKHHLAQPVSLKVVARAESAGGVRFIEGTLVSDDGDRSKDPKPVLRVSDDQGATWTTHPISAPAGMEGSPHILAVEGSDPFRALVALQRGTNEDIGEGSGPEPIDPIFLTTDGGETFSLHNAELKMADTALRLPSGQVLLADRGKGGGLWSAPSIDAPLSKILDEQTYCLGYRADTDTLFVCRAHELGVLDLATRSFCAFFQNREALTLQSCPSQPVTANRNAVNQLCGNWCSGQHFPTSPACASAPALATCTADGIAYNMSGDITELPGSLAAPRCAPPELPSPDAGVDDAGGEAGVDEEPGPDDDERGAQGDGCGCRLARTRRSDGPLALISLFTLCAFVVRRRAARQPRV